MSLSRWSLAFTTSQPAAPFLATRSSAPAKSGIEASHSAVAPPLAALEHSSQPDVERGSLGVNGQRLAGSALAVAAVVACSRKRRQRSSAAARGAVATAAAPPKEDMDFDWSVQTEEPPANLREWRLESEAKVKASGKPWPAPKNDRLLRAARGEPVDRPPKWMMRQAGRYLPEYMETLKPTDFFTVCKTPALACEVTLQPIRRYPTLDSMIIFSDILVVPVAMGMNCRMEPAVGPKFDFRLETPEDFKKLNFTPDVRESLAYVYDAIFWTRQRSGNEIPVIGFSGAPWTLMGYMVEGGAVRSFDNAKKWLYLYPEESKRLLAALRDIIVQYLVCQFDAGAPLLTIFDTNTGELPPRVYEEFCVQDLKYIAEEIKRQRPNALVSVFPKDGEIATFNDSAYDVVGCSWTISPEEARSACPSKTLQGNLDPYLLYAEPEVIAERTRKMVEEFGVDRYIANLGHGMLPTHPTRGPKAFIEAVDTCTKVNMQNVTARAAATVPASHSGPPLTLHLTEDTSVSVPVSHVAAEKLKQDLGAFVAMFKEKMAAQKNQRWAEFEHTSVHGDLNLEVFCNPNGFATIFDVRMFLTVRCGEQIKVSSEVALSSLQSDLDAFLS